MSNFLYQYLITIDSESSILKKGLVQEIIPHSKEMVILSNDFNSYEECFNKLIDFLSSLASTQSAVDNKNFVLVTKLNPLADDSTENLNSWPKTTISRSYIIDSDMINEVPIKYSAFAQISVKSEFLPKQANV